jgi:aspartate 1-decarboxylase
VKTCVHAKIHGLTVTAAELEYSGSTTIDAALLDASGWAIAASSSPTR